MKAAVALTVALLSAAAAQAAVTETVNGLTYSIQYFDADGSELPVELGPASFPRGRRDETDPEASSSSSSSPRGRRAALLQQRSQTFENWCGAANLHPPGNGTWSRVSGKWTVPTIRPRPGQTPSSQPALLQGVSIGGDGCLPHGSTHGGGSEGCPSGGGIVSGGIFSQIGRDGKQENYVYVDFSPEPLQSIQIPVSAGDVMLGTVTSDSPTTGNVTIINTTTGACVRAAFWGSRPALSGSSVQWIVSAVGSGSSGKHDPLADFTDICFRECKAATSGGKSAGPGTNNINLMQRGRFLCTGRIDGSNVHLHSSN